jgi:hypothetical protein
METVFLLQLFTGEHVTGVYSTQAKAEFAYGMHCGRFGVEPGAPSVCGVCTNFADVPGISSASITPVKLNAPLEF